MRELRSAGAFVRGWETFSHFFTMFRAASLRHLLISAFLASAVSCATMLGDMGDERAHVTGYTRAAAYNYVWPSKTVSIVLPDGSKPSLSAAAAYEKYVQHFGGRTYGFFFRIWALRALLAFVLFAPLLAWGMVTFGRYLSKARTLRGAQLVDTTKEDPDAPKLDRGVLTLVMAFGVGAIFVVLLRYGSIGPFRIAMSYTAACLASVSSAFAGLLSADGSGSTIWVASNEGAGFLAPEAAMRFHRLQLGHSLLGFAAMLIVGGTGGVFATRLALRRVHKDKEEDTGAKSQPICFGKEELPVKLEPSGILITGSIGSGKSVAIKAIADTIRAREQRAIVNDIKGDMTALYYRPNHDIILNPLDERCAPWTPWAEIRDRSDFARLAKSLFPPMANSNEFFSVSGASLFAAIMEKVPEYCKKPSNQELAYILTKATIDEVAEVVKGTVAARYMESKTGDMSSNLLATLSAQLESLTYLPDIAEGQKSFSLRAFMEEESDRWLFITMRPEDEAVLRPLLTCWYDVALDACLGLPDVDTSLPVEKQRRIFCLLDEVTRLGNLRALPGALREGRSKGLAVALGLQSVGDVRSNYGRDVAEALLGQPQTALVLRTTEPDTAKWLERLLGRAERERTAESQSMGANSQRDGVSLSRQINTNALVLDTEIQTLPDLTAFLKVVNEPLKKLSYTWKKGAPGRNEPPLPGFVQRKTLPEPRRPPWLPKIEHE